MTDRWQLTIVYVSDYYCGTQDSVCLIKREWEYDPIAAEFFQKNLDSFKM